MTPLELALHYADLGLPVFPCRAGDVHDSDTGELIAEVKEPLVRFGFKAASTDTDAITKWWSKFPDALVGMPTGERSGVFVLDVDNKHDGSNGHEWVAQQDELPDTRAVITPNNGRHILFNYVDGVRNRGEMGPGVDVRGEGGYVIMPGSKLSDGREYRWEDDSAPVSDAPEWLLSAVIKKKKEPSNDPVPVLTPSSTNDAYVNAAVDAEISKLASTAPGGRNSAINDAAFAIGTLVGAGALARGDAESQLESVVKNWDNYAKSCGTIKSGLDAGISNPRKIPEKTTQQPGNTSLVDISRMISNGLKKAHIEEGVEPEEIEEEQEVVEGPIHATPFVWTDPSKLPRREFVFGKHFIRKYVSVTVAPGGIGKTNNSVIEALSMATGRDLIGQRPDKRARCWIFNAEDPRDEMERRLMACCIHYRISPADIAGHVFLDTGREQELVVAMDDRSGVTINVPVVEAVVEQITKNKIDVMIVDPFVSTHGVNENDNGAIDKVAKLWAHIADRTNCSIDIVHHMRKVSDRESTIDDARGAVSLISAARSARVLSRMTDEQAARAGVKDRFGHFSITYGKATLTPMSSELDWRKLISVPLGNDDGLRAPQDFAPVVTEWKWPSAEDMVKKYDGELVKVSRILDNGMYKLAANSKEPAAMGIAYALGLDTECKTERKRCAKLMDAWIKNGDLVVHDEKDAMTRKLVKYVRSKNYVAQEG